MSARTPTNVYMRQKIARVSIKMAPPLHAPSTVGIHTKVINKAMSVNVHIQTPNNLTVKPYMSCFKWNMTRVYKAPYFCLNNTTVNL